MHVLNRIIKIFLFLALIVVIFCFSFHRNPETIRIIGRARFVYCGSVSAWFGFSSSTHTILVVREESGKEWRVGSIGGSNALEEPIMQTPTGRPVKIVFEKKTISIADDPEPFHQFVGVKNE